VGFNKRQKKPSINNKSQLREASPSYSQFTSQDQGQSSSKWGKKGVDLGNKRDQQSVKPFD
jgi:hypothetical protein